MGRDTYSSHYHADGSFSSPYISGRPSSPEQIYSPRSAAILDTAYRRLLSEPPNLALDHTTTDSIPAPFIPANSTIWEYHSATISVPPSPTMPGLATVPTTPIPRSLSPARHLSNTPIREHRLSSLNSSFGGRRLTAIHRMFRQWSLDLGQQPEPDNIYTTDIPFSFPFEFSTVSRTVGEPTLMTIKIRDFELTYSEIYVGVRALSIDKVTDVEFFHNYLPLRYRFNRFPYCLDSFLHILSYFQIIGDTLCDLRSNLPIARETPYLAFMDVIDRWRSDSARDNCFNTRPGVLRDLVQQDTQLFFTDGLLYAKSVLTPNYQFPFRFQIGRLAPIHDYIDL
ncbi:hypothetical protein PQX77_007098 [Marasmius sp. AFHP31]|nr:hypothetical protein PQX77_007098 [Marasmius sp. AFHP31]